MENDSFSEEKQFPPPKHELARAIWDIRQGLLEAMEYAYTSKSALLSFKEVELELGLEVKAGIEGGFHFFEIAKAGAKIEGKHIHKIKLKMIEYKEGSIVGDETGIAFPIIASADPAEAPSKDDVQNTDATQKSGQEIFGTGEAINRPKT